MEEQISTNQKELQRIIIYSVVLFILLFFFVTPCVYHNDSLYGKFLVTSFETSLIILIYTAFIIFTSLKLDFPVISTLFFIYMIALIYLFIGKYSASISFNNFPSMYSIKHDVDARYNAIALISLLTFVVLPLPCIFYKSLKAIGINYIAHIVFLFFFYISLSQLTNIYELNYKKSYIDFYKGSFKTSSYFYHIKQNAKDIINIFVSTENS